MSLCLVHTWWSFQHFKFLFLFFCLKFHIHRSLWYFGYGLILCACLCECTHCVYTSSAHLHGVWIIMYIFISLSLALWALRFRCSNPCVSVSVCECTVHTTIQTRSMNFFIISSLYSTKLFFPRLSSFSEWPVCVCVCVSVNVWRILAFQRQKLKRTERNNNNNNKERRKHFFSGLYCCRSCVRFFYCCSPLYVSINFKNFVLLFHYTYTLFGMLLRMENIN